ncbi:MAG: type I-B CRISPR-associated protein Cas5b [Promethearchaeota archaeon]
MTKVLIFEITGRYGFFKSMETTRYNFSYPFPPRTAIIGMIGAILGIERNTYWIKDGEWKSIANANISIEVVSKPGHYGLKLNLTQTKYTTSIAKDVVILFPKDPLLKSRGFVAPVRIDLLKDPWYRVYIHLDDNETQEKLKNHLKNRLFCYPPYLGHANLHANIEFIGEYEINKIDVKKPIKIDSLIPIEYIDLTKTILLGSAIIYNQIPMSLSAVEEDIQINNNPSLVLKRHHLKVEKLANLIYQEPDQEKGLFFLKEDTPIFSVILEGKEKITKNIVFLPHN